MSKKKRPLQEAEVLDLLGRAVEFCGGKKNTICGEPAFIIGKDLLALLIRDEVRHGNEPRRADPEEIHLSFHREEDFETEVGWPRSEVSVCEPVYGLLITHDSLFIQYGADSHSFGVEPLPGSKAEEVSKYTKKEEK